MVDYGTEPISDPIPGVNPAHRRLDGQVRSTAGKLGRLLTPFGTMNLEQPIKPEHVEPFLRRKAALQEEIDALQSELQARKERRRATPRHLTVAELSEEDRFRQLRTQSKHLIDTIKMVAYRAETAMANSLRQTLGHPDEALRLLQALYATEADLLPDPQAGTLTVRLHHLANASSDAAIQKLCEALNATETVFPRIHLRLALKVGSS